MNIKEKLSSFFGAAGGIIFYVLRLFVAVLPFIMIETGNFFISFILILINTLIPYINPIFWIWGLISAINGPQDFWAITYYIVFVVAEIPFYISLISALVSDIVTNLAIRKVQKDSEEDSDDE